MDSLKDPQTPILIVDDSSQYTLVLSKILKNVFGYQNVTSVDSPDKAIEAINKDPAKFKMLFVDFNFPCGTTGGALLERLNSQQTLKDKCAFLITSEPTVDNVKQASNAGAVGVVAKPFDREELRKQLDKAERLSISKRADSF